MLQSIKNSKNPRGASSHTRVLKDTKGKKEEHASRQQAGSKKREKHGLMEAWR